LEVGVKYLFLLHSPADAPEQGTPEAARMYADYSAALQVMAQAGVLIDCAPLTPAASATTVRIREDEPLLSDGPAAELKEQVGGYTLVECADLDEALRYAALMPAARYGSVEVRPVLAVGPPRHGSADVEDLKDAAAAGRSSSRPS
jgi:hypothetical protein